VIAWATSDGREKGGDRVVPATHWSVADPLASVSIEDERVLDALGRAHDSELPFLLAGHAVRVKTGELWPRVYQEVALVDRSLAVAVCSAPAALPSEIASVAGSLVRVNSS
jgi:hypothetical protein